MPIPDRVIDDVVRGHFADLELPAPDDGADLRDAGLTSLQIVDLILLIEMQLDVEIPQSEVTPANFHSIATIKATLQRISASRSND
jgi:acyl carrier protein